MNSDVDFAVAAWHESDTWNLEILSDPYNLGSIINELRSHQTNGGALGLIAIDEEFFILIRVLGSQISLFISDVTCALDYEVANEFLELADLPIPELDDALALPPTAVLNETLKVKALNVAAIV